MISVDFLLTVLELNDEPRTGWERRNVTKPQDVAGHSWGVAFLTLIFSSQIPDIDVDRAIKLALVHDIAESITGDLVVTDPNSSLTQREKHQREQQAMEELSALAEDSDVDFDTIEDLWIEYEARDSTEARFVKDMDMIEVCLLALKYETESRYDRDSLNTGENDLSVFFEKAEEIIETDAAKAIVRELKHTYDNETENV